MEQKQEKLYALLNEKLDHTEEISDEEILVEIEADLGGSKRAVYAAVRENHAQAATV